MAITAYTTADIIRALLGVSDLEITDAVINLPNYELTFLLEMEDIDKGVGAVKGTYDALPGTGRTAQQQRYFDLFGLMAAYSCARQLLTALDMSAPQIIGDNKAKMQRMDEQSKRLLVALNAGYDTVRSRLIAAFLVFVPSADVATAEASVYSAAVGLGSDPVLGT